MDIFSAMPEIMTSADVAMFCQCSAPTAVRLMKSKGFPLINPDAKRALKVNKYRFIKWLRGETYSDDLEGVSETCGVFSSISE